MRLIAAILVLLPLAMLPLTTGAWAGGPDDGPDGAVLLQAARSIVQVIASGCAGEDADRAGTGFAVGKDGLFVTDLHVVAGCTDYQLKYQGSGDQGGKEYPATLVHVLEARDLALLKVDPPPVDIAADLPPADRLALAQALAAVRLATLLPPTGFLTASEK